LKILSIDTSSNICGVSILENETLINNTDINTGLTHSESLMPLIAETLSKANLQLEDIDLLVCDKGPGSFTGIRIGISTVKAFHDSLEIPYIGVSSLEALAYNVAKNIDLPKYICSIIDCKNDNCYFALYENKNTKIETLIEPQAESIIATLSILNSYCNDTLGTKDILFIGNGASIYKEKISQTFSNCDFVEDNLNALNSYSLGLAGFSRFYDYGADCEVLPLYLKKSQAERQAEK
jgi:tRNA threonylcarbamoyl adenosine modification protein YeaZ